ncbi:hypothetical protein AMTRI_Chr02g213610 [Amborella trichopoda]
MARREKRKVSLQFGIKLIGKRERKEVVGAYNGSSELGFAVTSSLLLNEMKWEPFHRERRGEGHHMPPSLSLTLFLDFKKDVLFVRVQFFKYILLQKALA